MFKKAQDGRNLFFPWGVFGPGYIIDSDQEFALDATLHRPAPSPLLVRLEVGGDRYGVEIAVIDAGCGIHPDQRAQIFHPFFTTKPAGTGLGLASARAIVQAHEGTIGFDPIEAGGTRFWFRLPAAEATT